MIKRTNELLEKRNIKIEIAYFAGDTPIAQSFCGLKEGVGNANYPCRQCYIHKLNILSVFEEKNCQMRNIDDYANLLNSVDTKGVVKIPSYFDFKMINAVNQSPMDQMHVILEGICRKQIMRIFEEWTDVRYKRTNITEINRCIKLFNYQYKHEKNKIPGFSEYDLKKNEIVVSASQMKSLVLLFPFIFSDIVDIHHEEYK